MGDGTVRVLGVDPGTRVVGWGVVDIGPGRRVRHVASGPLLLPVAEAIPERLACLHGGLRDVIRDHAPRVLAVETVFHGKSFQSVLKVGEARGVVLLVGAVAGLEVHEFSPAMVKKAATGNGRASKSQVQRMITRILELEAPPSPVDVSDALAIACCYGQRSWRKRTGSAAALESIARATRGARRARWDALVKEAERRQARERRAGG